MTIGSARRGVLVLWVLCLLGAPADGQDKRERPAAEGAWKGVIVYVAAEQEVEIAVELFLDARGVPGGLIDIPTKPIEHEPLSNVRFEGNRVSWELRRQTGTFLYDGTLAADRNEISGRYFERGKTFDFSLKRSDPAAKEPPAVHPTLHTLSATGAELKERFNADAGKVRLVLLLSPG